MVVSEKEEYRVLGSYEQLEKGDEAITQNTLNWRPVNPNDVLFKRKVGVCDYYLVRRKVEIDKI